MVAKRVQKLRKKRQTLRAKKRAGGPEEKEKAGKGYVGRDVSTTSYLRAQGKAYAQGREGRSAYKAGEEGKSKSKSEGGKDEPTKGKNIDKRIRKVSKRIQKARKK